jgi:hypothetical protein
MDSSVEIWDRPARQTLGHFWARPTSKAAKRFTFNPAPRLEVVLQKSIRDKKGQHLTPI